MRNEGPVGYARAFRAARASLPCLALFMVLVGVAHADQFLPGAGGWRTYVNDRYGMRFDYPADIFTPEAPPQNGDGQAFTAKDASLEIWASHNVDGETPVSFRTHLTGTQGYENVTYSPSGETWLVVSGFRGNDIFYEKYFFRDGVISAFGIDFPKEQKPFYSPIVERIENSFKAGHSD